MTTGLKAVVEPVVWRGERGHVCLCGRTLDGYLRSVQPDLRNPFSVAQRALVNVFPQGTLYVSGPSYNVGTFIKSTNVRSSSVSQLSLANKEFQVHQVLTIERL